MKTKTLIKIILAVLVLAVGVPFVVGFNKHFGPIDTFPRLYKTAQCPDGAHSAAIYRRKVRWFSLMDSTDILLRVYDGRKTLIFEDRVYQLDVWGDMDSRYPEVRCNGEEIRAGGSSDGYPYKVRLSEISKK